MKFTISYAPLDNGHDAFMSFEITPAQLIETELDDVLAFFVDLRTGCSSGKTWSDTIRRIDTASDSSILLDKAKAVCYGYFRHWLFNPDLSDDIQWLGPNDFVEGFGVMDGSGVPGIKALRSFREFHNEIQTCWLATSTKETK